MSNNDLGKNLVPDELRNEVQKIVIERKQEIIDALMDLAKGIWREETQLDDSGKPIKVKIYKKAPDKEVAQYLLNQVMGKPKESASVQGKVNFIMDE
jgi:hypothetical protein